MDYNTSPIFTYQPDGNVLLCHLNPKSPTEFNEWCEAHGLIWVRMQNKPDELYGLTPEIFTMFKLTWDY